MKGNQIDILVCGYNHDILQCIREWLMMMIPKAYIGIIPYFIGQVVLEVVANMTQ